MNIIQKGLKAEGNRENNGIHLFIGVFFFNVALTSAWKQVCSIILIMYVKSFDLN